MTAFLGKLGVQLDPRTSTTLFIWLVKYAISEFQKLSLLKRGQVQNLSFENEIFSPGIKNHFLINGFTLGRDCKTVRIFAYSVRANSQTKGLERD